MGSVFERRLVADDMAKVLLDSSHKAQPRRVAVVVPITIFVQVQLPRRLHHGLEVGIGCISSGCVSWTLGNAHAMLRLLLPRVSYW
jgi:hypothetical protein